MYRCYFTQRGRILTEMELDVVSLSEAVAAGQRLLEEMAGPHEPDGIEIWEGEKLLYGSAGPRPEVASGARA